MNTKPYALRIYTQFRFVNCIWYGLYGGCIWCRAFIQTTGDHGSDTTVSSIFNRAGNLDLKETSLGIKHHYCTLVDIDEWHGVQSCTNTVRIMIIFNYFTIIAPTAIKMNDDCILQFADFNDEA